MAVNESIYRPKYKYRAFANNGKYMFTTTKPIREIIADNPDWQVGEIWDNSNVFTTYDPEKYGLSMFGSTHTDIKVDYDEPINSPPKTLTAVMSENVKINLRYVFCEASSGNSGGGTGFMWKGIEDYADLITLTSIINGGTYTYTDPNYKYWTSGTYNNTTKALTTSSDNYPLNNSNWRFVTDIDRNNSFYRVELTFSYIDDNGKLVNIGVTTDDINNWFQFNDEPYIDYQGHKCFITDIYVRWFGYNVTNNCFQNITSCYREDIESGTNVAAWNSPTTNPSFDLYIICEKVVNGKCYYFSIPISTKDNINFRLNYLRANFVSGNYTYSTSNLSPWSMNGTMSVINGFGKDSGYNEITTFYQIPNFNYDFSSISTTELNKVGDLCYFNGTRSTSSSGESYINNLKPFISVRHVFRMFACTLIPFKICGTNDAPSRIDANTESCYVGIRGEHGVVEGDYERFVFGETELDTEFRPEDFDPVDPENPIPPNPDNDMGDIPLGQIDPMSGVSAFVHSYIMGAGALSALGTSLWGGINSFDPTITNNMIDNFFLNRRSSESYDLDLSLSNLIDYFVSLRYYPIPDIINLSQSGLLGGQDHILVGTGVTEIKTKVNDYVGGLCYPVNNNVFVMDGGTLTVPSSGRFTDLEPNTSISLYVPFCGTTELMPSQVCGSVLTMTYCVDLTTGEMIAICCKVGHANFPVAILTGKIGFDQLITGNNANSQGVAASIGRQQFVNRQTAALFGNAMSNIGQAVNGNWANAIMNAGTNAFNTVMETVNYNLGFPLTSGSRPLTAGGASSMCSMLQPQMSFIQCIRHNPRDTSGHGETYGKMCNVWGEIGSQSGFVQVQNPRINVSATQAEVNEIHQLLQAGVYV